MFDLIFVYRVMRKKHPPGTITFPCLHTQYREEVAGTRGIDDVYIFL